MSLGVNRCGPVEADSERRPSCDHGGPTLPSDPSIEVITPCSRPATVEVPWPNPNVMGSRRLCGFHLARYLHDYGDEVEHKLRERVDLDGHLPEHVFTTVEDAPRSIELNSRTWDRIGLDQYGSAHYVGPNRDLLAVVDPDFSTNRIENLKHRGLEKWLEHTALTRGWADFDDRITPPASGGGRDV